MDPNLAIATLLAHGDVDIDEPETISPPIHQGVNYAFADPETFDEASVISQPAKYYRRFGNPTQQRLERLMAGLEGAPAALATASGMGAVSTTLLALTSSGDHIVAQRSMYGGTLSLLRTLSDRYGIDVTFVDQTDVSAFEGALTDRTRLVMVETPSNPTLAITDLTAISTLCRDRQITTWADNTVATPINQNPIEQGVDLVMHSMTKAIGGHADLQGGIVIGQPEVIERLWATHINIGAVISPFDAWLALRGIRTLAMRVEWQNRSAQAVAEYLAANPRVRTVNYPGLTSHPQHELARSTMRGYGCLLSFAINGGDAEAENIISAMRLPVRAASLGGMTTTIIRPAAMWAHELNKQQRIEAGVPDGLIRVAVGLEDPADLVSDIAQALASV